MTVQVTEGALSKVAKGAHTALVELVRNSIDADATTIDVTVDTVAGPGATLDGRSAEVPVRVRVVDDGHGISPQIAAGAFGRWGDSWKAVKRFSPGKRLMLGKNGEGRFAVYGLGASVEWDSVYRGEHGDLDDAQSRRVRIIGSASRRDHLAWEEHDVAAGSRHGTTVTVERLDDKGWLLEDSSPQKLIPAFALAMRSYPVSITYRGVALDPSGVIEAEADYPLAVPGVEARLRVIEWNRRLDRNRLMWCDLSGMTYYEEDPEIPAPGYYYTAYVEWDGARAASYELSLADGFAEEFKPLRDAARLALHQHFLDRAKQRRATFVDDLQAEGTYPFVGEPADDAERAERDLFDVIAVSVAPTVRSIKNHKAKRMTLSLLREALAAGPSRLRSVLEHVLDLPTEDLTQLHDLLQDMSLSGMVRMGRTVQERLLTLQGLRGMLFDTELYRRVLERQHLHELLARNTWIFGDEYALFASDQTLRTVVRRHIGAHLNRKDLLDAGVEALGDQADLRLDLGLAVQMRSSATDLQVLVVEIKRPSVNLSEEHAEQIVRYARALTRDPEMAGRNVRWSFLLVGRQTDDDLPSRLDETGEYTRLDKKHPVRVVPWADVLRSCEFRLEWLRQLLGDEPSRDDGLAHLRSVHNNLLPVDRDSDAVPRPRTARAGHEPGSVRAWAQSMDIPVAPRGRIPATVMDQYRQAHPAASPVDAT